MRLKKMIWFLLEGIWESFTLGILLLYSIISLMFIIPKDFLLRDTFSSSIDIKRASDVSAGLREEAGDSSLISWLYAALVAKLWFL